MRKGKKNDTMTLLQCKIRGEREMLKFKGKLLLCILGAFMCISGCQSERVQQEHIEKSPSAEAVITTESGKKKDTEGVETVSPKSYTYFNETGTCLKDRILVPEGFTRVSYKKNSFGAFLQNYPLCKSGQSVLLYNGKKKGNQNAHAAVFDMNVTDGDLQQCADSVIRMYAEYFYSQKQYGNMKFHFVNGFSCDFEKWSKGMRVNISGNDTSWYQGASADDSKEVLESYLRMVFSYASTLSMEQESEKIKSNEIEAGDIFIRGGSPGHVVMVVDVCENEKGERAFLLAQGYMPAQQFHILKNPQYEDNPWYYETEISYPFETPEYSFEKGSLMRPEYSSFASKAANENK